jgi:hypothetical protein
MKEHASATVHEVGQAASESAAASDAASEPSGAVAPSAGTDVVPASEASEGVATSEEVAATSEVAASGDAEFVSGADESPPAESVGIVPSFAEPSSWVGGGLEPPDPQAGRQRTSVNARFRFIRSARIALRAIHPPDEGYVADRIRFQKEKSPSANAPGPF